ncbi:AraC family ligand binding domain-containing protein [Cohnella ginsengisoli]|uniref:AraC family ligand binding domain-containing protein n=1 Tax=Cohnella ginsengisoli TaxID=425004 RepID=A0A9X4KL35_9BACL|nr:AraC family ligand binding domain-containing protein [Cohnella ginsengisoli]MDG0793885.1 AraC family ligand binding domain-containing protein [Cohnella ginsengisoli]
MESFIKAVENAQPVVHFANRWVSSPGESFGPRTIGDYQWIFVRSGKGSARIGGQSYRVYSGCLFAYGPGQPHWFRSSDDDPLVLYGLHFGYAGHAGLDDVLRMIQDVDWDRFEKTNPDVSVPFPARMETGAWPLPYFERLVEEYRGEPDAERPGVKGTDHRASGQSRTMGYRQAVYGDAAGQTNPPRKRKLAEQGNGELSDRMDNGRAAIRPRLYFPFV